MNTSATDSNPYEVFEAIIDENSISGIIFAITDVINNILVVLITIIIGTKCWILKFTRTALHAYFCTLGVVFFLSEALMLNKKYNVITDCFVKQTKTILHILTSVIGCGMTVSGTIRKFSGRDKHFVTLHGRLGVIACTLYTINLVMGVCAFNVEIVSLEMLHTIIGVVAYFVCILAQETGYNTGFFNRNFYCIKAFRIITVIIFLITAKDSLILLLLQLGNYWDSVFGSRDKEIISV